jgi:hypothetical protein
LDHVPPSAMQLFFSVLCSTVVRGTVTICLAVEEVFLLGAIMSSFAGDTVFEVVTFGGVTVVVDVEVSLGGVVEVLRPPSVLIALFLISKFAFLWLTAAVAVTRLAIKKTTLIKLKTSTKPHSKRLLILGIIINLVQRLSNFNMTLDLGFRLIHYLFVWILPSVAV